MVTLGRMGLALLVRFDNLGIAEYQSVSVAPATAVLYQGGSQQFAATLPDGASQTVQWSLSPPMGNISSNGLYTAPSTITGAQTITVTASALGGSRVGTATVTLSTGSGATFVGSDSATQGNWKNKYGADGYSIAGDKQSLASYDPTFFQNGTSYTWNPTTSDPRALQKASGSGALAATWYGNRTLTLNVNCTDTNSHQLALYALDWDNGGRSETIQITDTNTQTVLEHENHFQFWRWGLSALEYFRAGNGHRHSNERG